MQYALHAAAAVDQGAPVVIPCCTGKYPYRSAVRAWRIVRRPKHSRRRRCRVLDVYRCFVCGNWHIGKHFRSARAAFLWEED